MIRLDVAPGGDFPNRSKKFEKKKRKHGNVFLLLLLLLLFSDSTILPHVL